MTRTRSALWCSLASLCFVASSAMAASPSSPVSKLSRIGETNLTRSLKIVASADAAIDKAMKKGLPEKALAAADRARGQLEAVAGKSMASLEKTHQSLEAKFTKAENADQLVLALDFTAQHVEVLIDQHLTQCLENLDQSLADAGLQPSP